MSKVVWLIAPILALSACGGEKTPSSDGGLRSDMPARSASYYMQNRVDLTQDEKICDAWKGSQRPPLSWPAVVVNNCNNVDTAKTLLRNKADAEKLRREAGS